MRFPTPRFTIPLAIAISMPASLSAQALPAPSTNEGTPVSVRWNRLVPRFAEQAAASRRAARAAAAGDSGALRRIAQTQPPMPFRVYTVLSVAQYAASNSARDQKRLSPEAAVASASAVVLGEMFPDSAVHVSIERELARDLESARGKSGADRTAAAKQLGQTAARRTIASSPSMNLVAPWRGTIPTGPGMWYSAPGLPPIGIALASTRGWLLDSASQFRPGPPPAYGSREFEAGLDEVRRIARARTTEQTRIAQLWDSSDPWARWNDDASAAIRRHRMSETQAARVLAVLNVAASDAIVACFEAKYHYWFIRPSQADTTLALADSIGLPNFPSYPSGHACSAGAFDGALSHFFPHERAEFKRVAEEQAMSRLYGGIHYRFDNDGGLELGRVVARYVVEREKRGAFNGLASGIARRP